MKGRFFPLSVAVLTLLLGVFSCSDKENELTGKEALVGKWALQSITDEDGTYDYEHECSSKKDYLEFKSNNTVLNVYYYDDCSEEIETATYSVNGNKVTLSGEEFGGTSYTFTINNNELKLEGRGEIVRLKKL